MDELLERWGLTLGAEYPRGAAGRAFRVELLDGTPAVLKLSDPHRESLQEADALERWDGDGAVRLLARDDERHALLLERCEPGRRGVPVAAPDMRGRGLPRLCSDARDEACALRSSERKAERAKRKLDPKPLAAEREFAVAPIVRSPELGHSRRETLDRLDRLCSELGLDRERARGWTIVQPLAWAEGSSTHVKTVEWLR